MTYRVILTINGKYFKTLHRCKTKLTAYTNFLKIKETNNVFYPKKFINSTNGIEPVEYKICVTKITESSDVFRVLRNNYGKLYVEKPLGDWTILGSDNYEIEETFWLYGSDSKNDRHTIAEIVKRLMVGAHAKKMVKQVIVVHNKLIIYHESQFEMVICKNLLDAQRLHHTLDKIARKQKIKTLLFMGTASKASVSMFYEIIKDQTGWPITKIRRTSTRP